MHSAEGIEHKREELSTMALNRDETLLAIGFRTPNVWVFHIDLEYDLDTAKPLLLFGPEKLGHHGGIGVCSLTFSPNSDFILAVYANGAADAISLMGGNTVALREPMASMPRITLLRFIDDRVTSAASQLSQSLRVVVGYRDASVEVWQLTASAHETGVQGDSDWLKKREPVAIIAIQANGISWEDQYSGWSIGPLDLDSIGWVVTALHDWSGDYSHGKGIRIVRTPQALIGLEQPVTEPVPHSVSSGSRPESLSWTRSYMISAGAFLVRRIQVGSMSPCGAAAGGSSIVLEDPAGCSRHICPVGVLVVNGQRSRLAPVRFLHLQRHSVQA